MHLQDRSTVCKCVGQQQIRHCRSLEAEMEITHRQGPRNFSQGDMSQMDCGCDFTTLYIHLKKKKKAWEWGLGEQSAVSVFSFCFVLGFTSSHQAWGQPPLTRWTTSLAFIHFKWIWFGNNWFYRKVITITVSLRLSLPSFCCCVLHNQGTCAQITWVHSSWH